MHVAHNVFRLLPLQYQMQCFICLTLTVGSLEAEDKAAYWHCQLQYLKLHAPTWLPTIGMPSTSRVTSWAEITPAAMTSKSLLLILDSGQLVFALRTLQGWVEQGRLDESGVKKRVAVLGKVAELYQHLQGTTPESFCRAYGLQLEAAYSTSKPRVIRFVNLDLLSSPKYILCSCLTRVKSVQAMSNDALHLQAQIIAPCQQPSA